MSKQRGCVQASCSKSPGLCASYLIDLLLVGIGLTLAAPQANAQAVTQKWAARYEAANTFATPSAMATDSDGNAYVTGNSCFQGNCISLTIKYDPDGKQVWRAPVSSPVNAAGGRDIAVDDSGNVYVLSVVYLYRYSDGSVSNPEFATAKYSPKGQQRWISFFGDTATNHMPVKLALGPHGSVYVTGISSVPTSFIADTVLIHYDPGGGQHWVETLPGDARNLVVPVNLGSDEDGNAYVAVSDFFSSQIHNALIYVYDKKGHVLRQFGSQQLGTISAFHVDSQGTAYVAGGGLPQAPSGAEDPIVAKFDPDGSLAWFHDFGPPAFPGFALPPFVAIATSPSGDVFTVESVSTAAGSNISALKLDGSNGALQLQRNYNGHADGTGFDSAVGVAVDSMGNPYVTGSSSNPNLNCCVSNIATIKYDGAGNQLWVQRYQGPTPGPDVPVAVVAGRNGNVFVTGSSFNPDNGAAAWVTIDYAQTPESLTTGIVSQKRPDEIRPGGRPETQPNP